MRAATSRIPNKTENLTNVLSAPNRPNSLFSGGDSVYNKKRTIPILLFLLILSCILLSACSDKAEVVRDTNAKISVSGASGPVMITVYAINEETKEEVEFEVISLREYTSDCPIDYGRYTVKKVAANDRAYKIDAVTESFVVEKDAANEIVIEVKAEDRSGTVLWFLENNAFTLFALTASCVALLVVRWKKNKRFIKEGPEMS